MKYIQHRALTSILTHLRVPIACALLTIVNTGTASPANAQRTHNPFARAAHVVNATDTARLHYIHSSGSQLVETGSASGSLPGSMRANVSIGATLSGNFTIYVHGGGSIRGHGLATPHGSGTYESFSGSLTVTGGTGRYTHAHGHAGLYGTFNRKTYALVVQTTGRLTY